MQAGWQQEDFPSFIPKKGESYGIATGKRSGVFVIDLDGEEAIKHFYSLGPVPKTFTVRTGREEMGVHLYFQMPSDGSDIRNDQGRKFGHMKIDVRGSGGYVVGPGSPHRSGRTYEVVDRTPPAVAPEWVLAKLRMTALERAAVATGAPIPVDPSTDEGGRYIQHAVEYLTAIQEPDGQDVMWEASMKLMRTFRLPLETALGLIEEHLNPRCNPEWDERELVHKLENARDQGTWLPGIPSEEFPGNLIQAAHKPKKAPATVRKRPDPKHAYSFTPGDRPAGDKKSISFANAIADLVWHQAWAGVLQYDEFRKRAYAVDPPMEMDAEKIGGLSKKDGLRIAAWFEVNSMHLLHPEVAHKAAIMAAHKNTYHPVIEYLDSCGEQVTGILDTLATKVLKTSDPQANEFLKKTLVAAVRRIRKPGCQMDTVLVLYGQQGIRKTTFVRELFGPEFVRSQMPDLATKDASQALGGFWAIELAELTRIINSESSTVKEFLTRTFDDYRPPYGDTEMRFARECVLIGTTNDKEFLSDATGNRRYLPIEVKGQIDIKYLHDHRDEIWAEACALESAGYPHWYEDETLTDASRKDFMREDAWHSSVEEYLKGREQVTNADVYKDVVMNGDGDISKYDRRVQMRIAEMLRGLGCTSVTKGNKRMWEVPAVLKNASPSAAELRKRQAYNALEKLAKQKES